MPSTDEPLAMLAASVRACRICVDEPLKRPLPHAPRPVIRPSSTARVLIAGQAPGTKVHLSGIPFTDPSGDRLRQWLGVAPEVFYDEARVAILPMGFCFPGQDAKGGDLPPRPECAPAWRAKLLALMPNIELVLAIGLYAQRWHLGTDVRDLTSTVAGWRRIWAEPRSPRVLPLPHPSWRNTGWLNRNPWFEADVLPVLRNEIARLMDY
ncbi:MAG: uracil-DNA glycosylase family protein [Ancalomicrobiaceae bacterium]|nr:uracil-DNA glycosylase family protein [Ancalomicrobiaceae bacterium]